MGKAAVATRGGQRLGSPTPKVSVITMQDVPEPPAPGYRGKYEMIWAQIGELKPGKALRVDFETDKQARYVRGVLRKKAKKERQFLSHSRSADDHTMYFWLEKS